MASNGVQNQKLRTSIIPRTDSSELRDYPLPNEFVTFVLTCLCVGKFRHCMRFGFIAARAYQHVGHGPQLPRGDYWLRLHLDTYERNNYSCCTATRRRLQQR